VLHYENIFFFFQKNTVNNIFLFYPASPMRSRFGRARKGLDINPESSGRVSPLSVRNLDVLFLSVLQTRVWYNFDYALPRLCSAEAMRKRGLKGQLTLAQGK